MKDSVENKFLLNKSGDRCHELEIEIVEVGREDVLCILEQEDQVRRLGNLR